MSQELFDQLNGAADPRVINYLQVASQLQVAGAVIPNLSGGNVFYVSSVTGSDLNAGTTVAAPFATVNKAVSKCTANHGDWVIALPGHVEAVAGAAGMTVGVAGVTVFWLGNEADRAQINFKTSTAATVTITAASTVFVGCRIRNSIDARVDGLIISAADCKLIDTELVDDTAASSLISIRTTAAGTRLKIKKMRCYFAENTGSARTELIRLVGGAGHEISEFWNDAAATYSTSVLNNVTTALTGLVLKDCVFQNGTTAPAATFVSTSTGLCAANTQFTSTGVSAVTLPTEGNYVTSADCRSLGGVGGSSPHALTPAAGAPIAFQKSITSSAILHTAATTFMTCTGGSVLIEGITLETDATGLAGGTNFQVQTDNANGISGVIAAETVANLGANVTIVGTAASITAFKVGVVLEAGKHLKQESTVADCTGAGKVFVNVWGRVMSGSPVLS